jgi:hypothetical protein
MAKPTHVTLPIELIEQILNTLGEMKLKDSFQTFIALNNAVQQAVQEAQDAADQRQ